MTATTRLFKVTMSPEAGTAVAKTLESGYIGQGPKVEEFERRLGDLLGAPVLTTGSCTQAIDLALLLLGVGPGDEVATTTITCSASNSPIVLRGARPIWCDVNPRTGLIDPDDVKRKITKRTKAIIAVDWGGLPCDYDALRSLGVPVIEDAAHAFTSTIRGQPIGRVGGDYVAWSFGPIKSLTCGDGGALAVPPVEYKRAKLLRWYGLDRTKGESFRCAQRISEVGGKFHMNDIAATIGLSNLDLAIDMVAKARSNARVYNYCLPDAALSAPRERLNDSAWWLYTILVPRRDDFIAWMKELGIETSPVHARNDVHPAFNYPNGQLPGVDFFSAHEVAIPVGGWLTPAEVSNVAAAARQWIESEGAVSP